MSRYDFSFSWDSTYGLAAELLDRVAGDGLVLDLGCGEGVFADPIGELGRAYIGVDVDEGSVERCRSAGLDVFQVDLSDLDAATPRLMELVGERIVAAISLLDVVEHLVEPERVLAGLARLVERLGGPVLVVSVPNVAHVDLGAKLLLGRWDVTTTGLLDDTHVTLFDARRLASVFHGADFVELGRSDKQMALTEQAFPRDHPAIERGTPLRSFLEAVRTDADGYAYTYQFVRAFKHEPGSASSVGERAESGVEHEDAEPFCSVVIRTLGNRASLDDALTCLAAQSDRDLEVLLMVHSDQPEVIRLVEQRVAGYARSFAELVRVVPVTRDGRAAPLNAGFDLARGRYLAFLDDDDVVTADWIAEFRRAATAIPGAVVRTQCAVQDHRRLSDALSDFEPTSGFSTPYNPSFDFIQHRRFNQTPICSWAVPVVAARSIGLRFDESLAVCEDWEFLLRAASLLGVSNCTTFTSVYRRFVDSWGSAGTIPDDVWLETARAIRLRLDSRPTLVPSGAIESIARLDEQFGALSAAHASALDRIEAFERSRYWRASAPLRWLTSRRGSSVSQLRVAVRRVTSLPRPWSSK